MKKGKLIFLLSWLVFFSFNLHALKSAEFYLPLKERVINYFKDLVEIKKRCYDSENEIIDQDYLDQALSWFLQDFYNDFFTPKKIETIFCLKEKNDSWIYDFAKAFKQIQFTKSCVFMIPQIQKFEKKLGIKPSYVLRKKSLNEGFDELFKMIVNLILVFNSLSIQKINQDIKRKINHGLIFLPITLKIYLTSAFSSGLYNYEYLCFLKDCLDFDCIKLSFWYRCYNFDGGIMPPSFKIALKI